MQDSNASPQQQLLEKLKASTNILVTVSNNPSVDQLAACLGLTLWLNKVGKHATAVFSGDVPSTLEFLQPEETLEKNTDSLRDFIIALDKSKADKLRYKVEDRVVKIFITPYRTSLSADDLEFSQGDFNVDMVVALGVAEQQDLDLAITAHGRILHDATVATVTVDAPSQLGAVNWCDTQASSLSELVVDLGNDLSRDTLDGQIATALLTGIVAETARFSNEKTTPQTMNVSAQLMAAGANQQLVASKLDEPPDGANPSPAAEATTNGDSPTDDNPAPAATNDGTLEIDHQGAATPDEQSPETTAAATTEPPANADAPTEEPMPEEPDEDALLPAPELEAASTPEPPADPFNPAPAGAENAGSDNAHAHLVTEPPVLGGTLTANSRPDDIVPEPTTDPLSLPPVEPNQPILDRSEPAAVSGAPEPPVPEPLRPAPPSWMPPQPWLGQTPPADQSASQPSDDQAATSPSDKPAAEPPAAPVTDDTPGPATGDDMTAQPAPAITDNETLTEIEASVASPHSEEPDLNSARDEVMKAIASTPPTNPEPVQSLNAQPIDLEPPQEPTDAPTLPAAPPAAPASVSTAFDPTAMGITDVEENGAAPAPVAAGTDPAAPPVDGPVDQPFTLPLPPAAPPADQPASTTTPPADPNAPPPVPPPLFPPAA